MFLCSPGSTSNVRTNLHYTKWVEKPIETGVNARKATREVALRKIFDVSQCSQQQKAQYSQSKYPCSFNDAP
eukprot:scaffold406_cov57-Cylindrotheca_fusiformis.AAC.11